MLAFSGAFVVLAVLSFGTEGLQAKLNSVTSAGSLSNLSTGRFALWESLLLAILNFWMTGSGVGSHAEIYPTWLSQQFGVRFSHAESGYMQVMLELGLPGLVLLLTGIALIGFWAVCAWRANHDEDRRRVTILAAGIVASVLHSFIDFVWYIPACMILTLVIAACLCRCYQLSGSDKPGDTRVHNRRWPAGMAWAFLILFMPVCQLSASVTLRNAQTESDWLQYRDSDKPVDERIQHLENCVSTDPADFQSMARLSGLYFERFETKTLDSPNKMTALEIRSTVRSAEFESTKAIAEWMVRAFGEEAKDLYKSIYMARRALKGMPMRTEPYIVLSQLGFLIGVSDEGSTILLDQALRLRPHSPEVLLRAGLSCSERGELDLACEFLSKACKLDYRLRPTVVNQLAPYMSAEEFINRMAPGPDGLWLLFRFHQNKKRTNDEAFVAAWFCNNFESLRLDQDEADFYFWPRASELFTANSDAKNALFCLEQGVQRNPNDYALRINLAVSFWKAGRIEESRRQFDWCKLRNPDHKQLLTAIEELKADGGAL